MALPGSVSLAVDSVKTPARESKKPCLLLVDDERGIRDLLAVYFEHKGFAVATASTVEEGKSLLLETKFDVVITDWNLEGLEGLELISYSKKLYPSTPVVVYTGVEGPAWGLMNEALLGRADAVVRKLTSLEKLSAEVFGLLKG